jgi:hypothetical protein
MSLLDAIADAELTVVDEEQRVVFAWFGGAGVNVYDEDGEEVYYFTIGGASKLSPITVRAAIRRVMAETVY